MKVKNLKLDNFRNHTKREFCFDSDLVIICGPNGSGKTNILESLSFLSHGKSQRAVVEKDMIRINYDFSKSTALLEDGTNVEIIASVNPLTQRVLKVFKINNVEKKNVNYVGRLKTVMFAPEDIKIVSGSPSRRRDYLDRLLSQIFIDYRKNLLAYEKALKNRNALLEQIRNYGNSRENSLQLEVWNERFVSHGEEVLKKRLSFFEFANKHFKEISNQLFRSELYCELDYYKSEIANHKLNNFLERDIRAGVTTFGPHREDFGMFVYKNGIKMDLKNFGSRGQQRTAVLCLKILEIKFIEELTKEKPILLMDDIFSELDDEYRLSIRNIMDDLQTLITTADEKMIPDELRERALMIRLL